MKRIGGRLLKEAMKVMKQVVKVLKDEEGDGIGSEGDWRGSEYDWIGSEGKNVELVVEVMEEIVELSWWRTRKRQLRWYDEGQGGGCKGDVIGTEGVEKWGTGREDDGLGSEDDERQDKEEEVKVMKDNYIYRRSWRGWKRY